MSSCRSAATTTSTNPSYWSSKVPELSLSAKTALTVTDVVGDGPHGGVHLGPKEFVVTCRCTTMLNPLRNVSALRTRSGEDKVLVHVLR